MAIIFRKAPGKIILFGEHAVVYGQPAIAIPVTQVHATARVFPKLTALKGTVHLQAPDINLDTDLSHLPANHPLAAAIRVTLEALKLETLTLDHLPAFTLQISSTIPISAGMGSGAAISVAIIRALSDFLGKPLSPEKVSDLAYEVEKIFHGNPSGVDNNVITYQKPVYFSRGQSIQFLSIKRATHWVIADSGEKTPTRETVSAVRDQLEAQPNRVEMVFQKIGALTVKAKNALINGDLEDLGDLLNENQKLLEALDVSSPNLENLIKAAKNAGAIGAKLSGGGRGGNIIALVPPDKVGPIKNALTHAGASHLIDTTLPPGGTT